MVRVAQCRHFRQARVADFHRERVSIEEPFQDFAAPFSASDLLCLIGAF